MVIACKLAGVFFVLCASGYFAVNVNQTLENRNTELRRLYSLLLQLKSEIQYMGNTLPECFEKLSLGAPAPFKNWMQKLADRLKEKTDMVFGEIWQEELTGLYEDSSLDLEDMELLRELADKLGSIDRTVQLKAIDYVLLQTERNRTALENELKQKKKVVMTLSLFCGFMTLILLL